MPDVDGIYQYTSADTASPAHILLNRLGDSVRTRLARSGWTGAALSAGWLAYGAPYAPPGWCIDAGWGHLRGMVKSGSAGTAIFVIPDASAPEYTTRVTVEAAGAWASVSVAPTGVVRLEVLGAGGTTGYVSLDGVAWKVKP